MTTYTLTDRSDPNDPNKVWSEGPSRTVPNFSYRVGTGVERVYTLDKDSWLADFTSLGAASQTTRLARIKNTFEPTVRYLWVPQVDQNDIAQFDTLDRIRKKSLVLYGLTSRVIGRFTPLRGSEDTIPEITPEVEELPEAETSDLLDDLGGPRLSDLVVHPYRSRRGEVREIFNVSLLEGYNIIEARQNEDPNRNAFTDLTGVIKVTPSNYGELDFSNTFNRERGQFTSYEITSRLRDDRGDSLIGRYSFIDKNANPYASQPKSIDQLQAGAEVVLGERLRFGYFTRYDAPTGTFIENLAAFRILSSCNCWHLDLGYSLETNPSREKYLLTFTFGGLGGITQAVPYMGYRSSSESQ